MHPMDALQPAGSLAGRRLGRLASASRRVQNLTVASFVPPAAALVAALQGAVAAVNPKYGMAFAVGVGFTVLVFVDLTVGVSTMVVLAFLESLTAGGGLSLAKGAGLVLVAAWVGLMATSRVSPRSFFVERAGLTYVLLLFLGWAAVSLLWADVAGDARTSLMRYVLNAVLIPVVYTAMRNPKHAQRILGALLVGAILAGISGVLAGPSPTAGDRATGTVGDANELAAALVLSAGVAGAFLFNRHVAFAARALGAVALPVCLAGIVLSLSRGGLLGLGGASVAAVVLAGRWRGRVAVAVGAIVMTALGYFLFFASLPAKERVSNVGGGGTGRLDLWTVAERMIAAHPLQGVGTGQFQTSSVHYLLRPGAIERADFILSHPKVAHNTYLNVVAELGVVGGALFVGLVAASVYALLRAVAVFRRLGDERMEILVRGTAVGVVGYLVTLVFISENYSKLFWLMLALGPALLAVALEQERGGATAWGAA